MISAHTYWIPTNRVVRPCLASYVRELDYWRRLTGEVVPAFILDSGNPAVEKVNEDAVVEVGAQYPMLHIQHVSYHEQRALVSRVIQSAGLPTSYVDYFVPGSTNYGAVMNKIALFAAANGSDFIHRRDSDTVLQDNCPFPLEAEMLALRRIGAEGGDGAVTPAAVGSGYVGEWNMDLKPFIAASPELFSVFWQCLGVDSSLHEQIYATLDQGSRDYYQHDGVRYTDKNGFNLPDAGNVVLAKIYQLFPSLPSNAMSSDYMPFRFARGCGIPIVYHQRRVVHEYHAERGDNIDGYLKSLLKYSDLRPVYGALESAIRAEKIAVDFDVINRKRAWFGEVLGSIIDQDKGARLKSMDRFVREFIAKRYPHWAEHHALTIEDTLEECIADYGKHIDLIVAWDKIMASARAIGAAPKRHKSAATEQTAFADTRAAH
jgi:hypothetical protein